MELSKSKIQKKIEVKKNKFIYGIHNIELMMSL